MTIGASKAHESRRNIPLAVSHANEPAFNALGAVSAALPDESAGTERRFSRFFGDDTRAHLRQDTHNTQLRDARDFGPAFLERLKLPGHLHRCATTASDIQSLAKYFDFVVLRVGAHDLHFAVIVRDRGSDFHGDASLVVVFVDLFRDTRSGHTSDNLPRIAQEAPDKPDRLLNLERFLNADRHGFNSPHLSPSEHSRLSRV